LVDFATDVSMSQRGRPRSGLDRPVRVSLAMLTRRNDLNTCSGFEKMFRPEPPVAGLPVVPVLLDPAIPRFTVVPSEPGSTIGIAAELIANPNAPPHTGAPWLMVSTSPLRAVKMPVTLQPLTTRFRIGLLLLNGRSYPPIPESTCLRSNSEGPYSASRLKLFGVRLAEFWL